MARIIDLTEADESPEILTRTTIEGGLLGGGEVLSTDPLASYLHEREQAKHVVRNKKAGLAVDRTDSTVHIEPDDEYQAVALVTDLRVLFVVGQEGEDKHVDVALSQIVEAKSRDGRLRTSTLLVNTVADESWRFSCKGDVGPIAAEIDEMAQVWTHSQRLIDEAETQVSGAKAALESSNIDDAREVLGDAEGKIRTAVDDIREVGPAATATVESRARGVAERLLDVKRELTASEGARSHTAAQRNWREQSYETAAQYYERAIEAYETAVSTAGTRPPDDVLQRRLSGAVREREMLRIGPLFDADAARRRAIAEDDPEVAAVAWEEALDGYRELLSLDWAKERREFVVDREKIRKQTVSIADDAIADHIEAGRQWTHSGDRLAVDGHEQQAREVYERAREQFENAEQLAREVRPEQLDTTENALEHIEERLSGKVPAELPEEPTLDTVVISGLETTTHPGRENGDPTPGRSQERDTAETTEIDAPSNHSVDYDGQTGGEETTARARADRDQVESPGVEVTEMGAERSELEQLSAESETGEASATEASEQDDIEEENGPTDSSTLLDQIRSKKHGSPTSTESEPRRPADGEKSGSGEEKEEASPDPTPTGQTSRRTDNSSTESENTEKTGRPGIGERLWALSSTQFDTLVSELWESQGWSTTQVSVGAESAVDIVALREEPREERLAIWTYHRPNQEIGVREVETCAQALADSRGADAATIVTTGEIADDVGAMAEKHDIALIGSEQLEQLLKFENMTDRLSSVAE